MANSAYGANTETYSERQENEIEVLQAVFIDDVKDLRGNDTWKVKRPPEVSITLRPQESVHSKEFHVQVDLYVKCPHNYPDQIPELNLREAKCLSNNLVQELQREVEDLAKTLVGEVMLLELCQHVQGFLHIHNKPPRRSFYEEMMDNRQKEDEKQKAEQLRQSEIDRKRSEKQAQDIDAVIQKRQEAVKEEARKRREQAKQMRLETERLSTSSDPSTPSGESMPSMTPILKDTAQKNRSKSSFSPNSSGKKSDRRSPEYTVSRERRTSTPLSGNGGGDSVGESDSCPHHAGTSMLSFSVPTKRSVYRGKCLGHSIRGSTVYCGLDTKSGELVAISEWVLKWRHCNRKLKLTEAEEKENAQYLKQISGMESEMRSLFPLSHPHLVCYHGYQSVQDTGKISVQILMDYAGGGSLFKYVKYGEAVPLELLKFYIIQLLEVLKYLHDKTIVHKDIRVSSMLLDEKGNLRLADCSVVSRLTELMVKADTKRQGVKFETSVPPSSGRGGKKSDVFRLGVVLLSLATGDDVTDHVPQVPKFLNADLRDFLEKCLVHDAHQRWSIDQLREHSFVKMPLVLIPSQQTNGDDGVTDGSPEEAVDAMRGPEAAELDIPFLPTMGGSGSRLTNEFDIMMWLGKGAFGDVIKVCNKLDGRFYAIKRIPLNPNRKQFTRKITREVKLLSRLNHENVVRYYNSWIETSDEPAVSDSSTSEYTSTSPTKSSKSSDKKTGHLSIAANSLGLKDDIEKFAPAMVDESVNWSVSYEISHQAESSSSDDEVDDLDVFGKSFMILSDSDDSDDDDIAFEHDDQSQDDESSSNLQLEAKKAEEPDSVTAEAPRLQFLYIQMEFCEKSTLRTCIDAGLHEDKNRVWRLFREIIEGLLHIHDQGMIHRDLKPVNIFMDSNDHVKIGDFGLATTEIIAKQSSLVDQSVIYPTKEDSLKLMKSTSKSESVGDLTGKVGTALYVSPEMLDTTSSRVSYNQKVDIYSLGVIFFEMCYRPLDTGMERVKVLTSIRQASVTLPQDFDEVEMQNQGEILRWLLNHNPAKRPSSKELLQSPLLPPPHMEEAAFNEVLRSAISNTESKSYHHMLNALFGQPMLPANDFAYDIDFYKHGGWSMRQAVAQQHITSILEQVFSRHGAVRVTTPLLMPRNPLYQKNESYVTMMDHGGGLVALPHDLRVPFARYIARNSISHLKRFCIEKVFRENRLYGVHPRELTACSFDIVTMTQSNLVPDAEALHVVHEIILEFPELQAKNFYLRINHVSLLKAILLYCNISEELHQDIYNILSDTKTEKLRKLQLQTHLYSLSLSEDQVEMLYGYVVLEKPFGQLASMLRKITHSKGIAASLAKKGLHEMEAVINHAQTMGCKLEPFLALGLVYSIKHFSGSIYQVVADVRRKKKNVVEVLAAGGRYDELLTRFRHPGAAPAFQCAVGVSISFEKIVSAVIEGDQTQLPTPYDILVCSLGHKMMIREKLSLAHQLWNAGLRVEIHHDTSQSLEDIQDSCKKQGISHIAVLKDLDAGFVKVQSMERDREKMSEKRLAVSEVTDYLLQKMHTLKGEISESVSLQSKSSVTGSQANTESGGSASGNALIIGSTSGFPPYSVSFVQDKEKLAKNIKRAYEHQIFAILGKVLVSLSPKVVVEVVATDLTAQVVNCISEHTKLNIEDGSITADVGSIAERHPRHKKYLSRIFDHIQDVSEQKRNTMKNYSFLTVIIYGLKDDSYKVLL